MVLEIGAIVVLFIAEFFLVLWCPKLREENKMLKENLQLTKDSLTAIATKPIYAPITDGQIERLGQVITSYLQPKQWQN